MGSSVALMSVAYLFTIQDLHQARHVLERLDIKGFWSLPGSASLRFEGRKPRFFGGHAERPVVPQSHPRVLPAATMTKCLWE